jgi:hypothetical protein
MGAKIATILLLCCTAAAAGCTRQDEPPANQADATPSEVETEMAETLPCTHAGTDAAYRRWQDAQQAAKADSPGPNPNVLVVEGGDSYRWNDAPVDPTTLRQYLDVVTTMAPTPWVIVRRAPGIDEAAVEKARERIFLSLDCRAEF